MLKLKTRSAWPQHPQLRWRSCHHLQHLPLPHQLVRRRSSLERMHTPAVTTAGTTLVSIVRACCRAVAPSRCQRRLRLPGDTASSHSDGERRCKAEPWAGRGLARDWLYKKKISAHWAPWAGILPAVLQGLDCLQALGRVEGPCHTRRRCCVRQ
jgi:hypothetical protein